LYLIAWITLEDSAAGSVVAIAQLPTAPGAGDDGHHEAEVEGNGGEGGAEVAASTMRLREGSLKKKRLVFLVRPKRIML
jgi:hypothetical protein